MMIENENSKEHSRLLFIRLCNVQKYTRGGGGGGGGTHLRRQYLQLTEALFRKIKSQARNIFICFKTSTNVLYFVTTVIKTQTAPTLMGLSCALVTMDILEMELCAKVNSRSNLLLSKAVFSKIRCRARMFALYFSNSLIIHEQFSQ